MSSSITTVGNSGVSFIGQGSEVENIPVKQPLTKEVNANYINDIAKRETLKLVNKLNYVKEKTPNLRAIAKELLKEQIKIKTGIDVDPDKLWLHSFNQGQSSSTSFTGWEHLYEKPTHSFTLTDMVLRNFSAKEQMALPGGLNALKGIYSDGPDKSNYGTHNEFRMTPEQLKNIIWDMNFQKKVNDKLKDFWGENSLDVQALAKAQFLLAARTAKASGAITEEDYGIVMAGAASDVSETDPLKFNIFYSKAKQSLPVKVMVFNINGHDATDIFYFQKGEKIILYIPGEEDPFHVFKNNLALNQWIDEQGSEPNKINKLAKHFSLKDRQNGILMGVDRALKKIGEAKLTTAKYSINKISGDVFTHVMEAMRQRSYTDAETKITSNNEILQNIWLNDLRGFNTIISPLLILSPSGVFGFILGSLGALGELGININKSINADSEEERKQGFANSLQSLFNIVLFHSISYASSKLRGETVNHEVQPTSQRNGSENSERGEYLDRIIESLDKENKILAKKIDSEKNKGDNSEVREQKEILQHNNIVRRKLEKDRVKIMMQQNGYEITDVKGPVDGFKVYDIYAKKTQGSDNLYELFYWDEIRSGIFPYGSAIKTPQSGWIKVGLEGGGKSQSSLKPNRHEEIEMQEITKTTTSDVHKETIKFPGVSNIETQNRLRSLEARLKHQTRYDNESKQYYIETTFKEGENEPGRFVNTFSEKEWNFDSNYKNPGSNRQRQPAHQYQASDIAIIQYNKVSAENGFYGELPEKIIRNNVVNLEFYTDYGDAEYGFNKEFIEREGEDVDGNHITLIKKDKFLGTTTGRHTKKIMDYFGLTATQIRVEFADDRPTFIIDVSVQNERVV
ncbi:dermonecrotic toxin domain-containing protein [Cedecea sp.]|jgi:hypothetical protein|uniref:dermonecrotic toxin domain-containing protein n=1 Tax=Cedecea sp. TaxID=1970739 RepID=UPI002F4174A8